MAAGKADGGAVKQEAPKVEPKKGLIPELDQDFRELEASVRAYAAHAEKLGLEAFKKGDVKLHAYYNELTNALGTVAGVFRGRKG